MNHPLNFYHFVDFYQLLLIHIISCEMRCPNNFNFDSIACLSYRVRIIDEMLQLTRKKWIFHPKFNNNKHCWFLHLKNYLCRPHFYLAVMTRKLFTNKLSLSQMESKITENGWFFKNWQPWEKYFYTQWWPRGHKVNQHLAGWTSSAVFSFWPMSLSNTIQVQ